MQTWIDVPADSDFPLENLPYGAFASGNASHIGVAIGDWILDLYAVAQGGALDEIVSREVLQGPNLDALLRQPRSTWKALRQRLVQLLSKQNPVALDNQHLVARGDARMLMPFTVRDYIDFYSSIEHATNMGKILRPNAEPLLPNWRYIPIGYHGRSSTIVIDGTPIKRPAGQRKPPDAQAPTFGPSASLDIELEMGFVTGGTTKLGHPIAPKDAMDHIFGMVIVNDWSARDIQAWEYQPLGPFLGKSFATSISPWVVTIEALEPYRVTGPTQEPPALPYLQGAPDCNYDIELEVCLRAQGMQAPDVIARSNYRYMYWNMAQQLAHATSNGAIASAGDLYASGTISGPTPDSYGSLMELTWRGAKPMRLSNGQERAFLEDGDEITLRAWCEGLGKPRLGFGSVSGRIVPNS